MEMACEEVHLVRLFEDTLRRNRGHLSDHDISNAVIEIINLFTKSITCPVENYKTPDMLWAYFFIFSPISAGLARNRMLEAMNNSEEFRSFFRKPSLKVLSIGSGHGSDLIGFCSALPHQDFPKLNLTLVDYNEHWKSLFEATIQVAHSGNYGNTSELFTNRGINYSFICSEVLNIAAYREELMKTDVVWMKGLLSVLGSDFERKVAIKAIVFYMQRGSLLVVIDSPSYHGLVKFPNALQLVYFSMAGPYVFPVSPGIVYGPGLCRSSNQTIAVHRKM